MASLRHLLFGVVALFRCRCSVLTGIYGMHHQRSSQRSVAGYRVKPLCEQWLQFQSGHRIHLVEPVLEALKPSDMSHQRLHEVPSNHAFRRLHPTSQSPRPTLPSNPSNLPNPGNAWKSAGLPKRAKSFDELKNTPLTRLPQARGWLLRNNRFHRSGK